MRILHTVHFYEPQKGGSEEVVRQISERLVSRGHEVTVATSYDPRRAGETINGVRVRQFMVAGNMVDGIAGNPDPYLKFVQDGEFDVVMNYAAQNWTTDLLLPRLDRIKAAKVLVPCGYSGLRNEAYAGYFHRLPGLLKRYDALIYMSGSTRDTVFGREHGLAEKETIIPNGAGEEFEAPGPDFRASFGIKTRFLAISVGNHTGLKGHDFVTAALRKSGRKDLTLAIIGDRLSGSRFPWRDCWWGCFAKSLVIPRVMLLRGLPRDMVVAAYKQADLFLFGSKVECAPLVMYEAFASRTPFITTDVGNVRDHSGVIRIVGSPGEMVSAMNGLLEDESARGKMAEEAHALWKTQHTWEVLAGKYEALYLSLIRGKGGKA